ncbi:unnamed protein product [Diatraea saccharalis]|uniref:Major facilitator superfamily (MFS) profile domain-containing protein n=1 Tax=Diatraea saccharalis TaxID=40085 RepID=A0A9N9WH00_9NEOP|nr:unnamed protein product [Diatraea saccharalis]
MSPMGPRLMSDDTPAKEPLDPEVISWMASIVYLVGTPAVFLFGFIVDNCGRKIALMITSLSVAMCWALKIYSTETWALITARAFLGLTVSGSYVVTPLYIKEISDDSIRGTLGSLVVLSQNLGNLVVYLMGTYMSYHCILWVLLAVPLVHLLVFTSMPDTPSYLLKSGKTEEARTAVAWLRCRDRTDPVVESELQKLQLELELNKSGKFAGALKTLVTDRGTFRAFRVTLAINSARELCGCVAVLHYASLIFSRASQGGWVLTPNQQAIVLGVVQMIGSLTASSLVERCGRKRKTSAFYVFYCPSPKILSSDTSVSVNAVVLCQPLLAGTCLVSGVCMACAGACVWAGAGGAGAGAGGAGGAWVPPLALCLAIYCDAAGLQPVPFVVMTEMFSFQVTTV